MASQLLAPNANIVRRKMRQFLTDRRPKFRRELIEKLSMVKSASFSAWSLGGFPRDLSSTNRIPRDIDIVVDGIDPVDAVERWGGTLIRETRFGGVHARIGLWPIDVWSLSQTWAFREGLVPFRGIDDLPKTTCFNIEAIAVELYPGSKFGGRRIVEHGFYEAMSRRLIEINLEDNPFPQLCVVRAVVFANRLQFALGPRLIAYLSHHMSKYDNEELVDVQVRHYGRVILQRAQMERWRREIVRHSIWRPLFPMKPTPVQAELF